MFLLLIAICWLSKASTSHVTLDGKKAVEYGSDAHYKCTISNSSGVLQVTWQRLAKGTAESMATYSERFGKEVNKPYLGKLLLTEASFSSASITLKNVTWEDESCYMCSFNIYPDGSKTAQTCLKVQGISEVKTTNRTVSGGDEREDAEVVFSCSATGKPAPTIEWNISEGASTSHQQPSVVTVTNSDHTFTSSSNITVKVPSGWSGHAECVLNRGKLGERTERIPFSYGKQESNTRKGVAPSVIALMTVVGIVVCVAVALVVRRMVRTRLKKKEENQSVV